MLRSLFDEGHEDETHERIADMTAAYDPMDLLNHEDRVEADEGQRKDNEKQRLGDGEFSTVYIVVSVLVSLICMVEVVVE